MEIRFLILFFFFSALFASEEEAIQILQTYLERPLATCGGLEKLPGMTNKNYLFSEGGKKICVVRLPGSSTERFIDRFSENNNSKLAYRYHFNPAKLLYFDAAKGIQITEYVNDFKTLEFGDFYNRDIIRKVATLLHAIHTSNMPFANVVNIFERIELLIQVLNQLEIEFPADYFLAKANIEKLRQEIAAPIFKRAPTHGDPVPSNFIKIANNFMLFDWEYSGLNDPAWDLAFLSSVMNYSEELEVQLIQFYRAKNPEQLYEKLLIFKPIVEFWLGAWGLLQTSIYQAQEEQEFFRYFAIARFRRSQKYHASFAPKPILCNERGEPLSLRLFNHWICAYCGILNEVKYINCICPTCPSKRKRSRDAS
jgi:thiamine kinase-like enzyme